jgi:hypothetical protein
MTDLKKAAQQALEALESGLDVDPIFAGETETALRAALEQTEQEPVARFDERDGGPVLLASAPMLRDGQLLYTDPPRREWRSLSEEEIGRAYFASATHTEYARAIEARLKEKNHE